MFCSRGTPPIEPTNLESITAFGMCMPSLLHVERMPRLYVYAEAAYVYAASASY